MDVHVAISTTNLDTSIHFYTQLGFMTKRRYRHQTLDGEWAIMHKNGFTLELFCVQNTTTPQNTLPMTSAGLHHVGIEVDSIDVTLNKLQKEAKIHSGTAVHRYAFITDPDNTLIELFEAKQ